MRTAGYGPDIVHLLVVWSFTQPCTYYLLEIILAFKTGCWVQHIVQYEVSLYAVGVSCPIEHFIIVVTCLHSHTHTHTHTQKKKTKFANFFPFNGDFLIRAIASAYYYICSARDIVTALSSDNTIKSVQYSLYHPIIHFYTQLNKKVFSYILCNYYLAE